MGAPQVYGARAFKGLEGSSPVGRLHIDDMPVMGSFDNHSADALVTDSAAAATAFATGVRVKNRTLSLGEGGAPLPTILEQAHAQGRSTGLVTTVSVSNATPAAFGAHTRERSEEFDVAAQLADHQAVDVLMGAGRAFFLPTGTDDGRRTDGRNLREEMRTRGWAAVSTRDALRGVPASTHRLLGLFAAADMSFDIDRTDREPSLAEMTEAALGCLSQNAKGFFLMVEGGKIDRACHANDLGTAVREVLAFDQAVSVALAYQARHPDTLVLVTADHETGGLSFPTHFEPRKLLLQRASVEATLTALPPAALNPTSEPFAKAVRERLGLDLDAALAARLAAAKPTPIGIAFALTAALTERVQAAFSTHEHSALPPLIWAKGPGQALFQGVYDITGIYARMAALLHVNAAVGGPR